MNEVTIGTTTIRTEGAILTVTTPDGVTVRPLVADSKEWWQMVDCSEMEQSGDALATNCVSSELTQSWDAETIERLHREGDECGKAMAAKVAKMRMGWDE